VLLAPSRSMQEVLVLWRVTSRISHSRFLFTGVSMVLVNSSLSTGLLAMPSPCTASCTDMLEIAGSVETDLELFLQQFSLHWRVPTLG
jgi:hypothetical protein